MKSLDSGFLFPRSSRAFNPLVKPGPRCLWKCSRGGFSLPNTRKPPTLFASSLRPSFSASALAAIIRSEWRCLDHSYTCLWLLGSNSFESTILFVGHHPYLNVSIFVTIKWSICILLVRSIGFWVFKGKLSMKTILLNNSRFSSF